MNTPMLSVIVPIYNVEPYLDQCIQSIVGQTWTDLEIILVDDGSPDRCPEMCDSWAEKDERIQVIHKANGGLSDARNFGLKHARGSYIGFIDSDDWIASDMYEKMIRKALDAECDIAACAIEMVFDDGTESRMLTHISEEKVFGTEAAMESLLNERELLQPVVHKIYRADLIKKKPFAAGKLHEDIFWTYQIIGSAQRVVVLPDIGYFYRQRSGSIMSVRYSLSRLDAIEAKETRQDYLSEKFKNLSDTGLLDLWFTCIYHGQLALRDMKDPKELQTVYDTIAKTLKNYPLSAEIMQGQSITHKFWLWGAGKSLKNICRLRNLIGIGL